MLRTKFNDVSKKGPCCLYKTTQHHEYSHMQVSIALHGFAYPADSHIRTNRLATKLFGYTRFDCTLVNNIFSRVFSNQATRVICASGTTMQSLCLDLYPVPKLQLVSIFLWLKYRFICRHYWRTNPSIIPIIICNYIWGRWCQKEVSQTWISNCITLLDAITYLCLLYTLLVPKSSYVGHRDIEMWISATNIEWMLNPD